MNHAEYPVLRFVNSVEDDGKSRALNTFSDVQGLMAVLGEDSQPCTVHSSLEHLLSFRESLFLVLSATAAARVADPGAVHVVQSAIRSAFSRIDVRVTPQGLTLQPGPSSTQIDVAALAAYDLMISEDFPRLSECRRCTRMFIDHGRGKGRRWCDMARCGNRAKAESYRARKRAEGDAVR